MAIKARFSSQQQPVKIVESDGAAYVFICLNGEEKAETYPDIGEGQTQETYYEYDYNEIVCPIDENLLQNIQDNPEEYLDYEYQPYGLSIEERVSALEESVFSETKAK